MSSMFQEDFDEKFGSKAVDLSVFGRLKNRIADVRQCRPKQFLEWLASWVPMIEWVRDYRPRQYIVSDLLAGATVGIMNIPQGSNLEQIDP